MTLKNIFKINYAALNNKKIFSFSLMLLYFCTIISLSTVYNFLPIQIFPKNNNQFFVNKKNNLVTESAHNASYILTDKILARQIDNVGEQLYLKDARGSVLGFVGAYNSEHYRYDSYGKIILDKISKPDIKLFTNSFSYNGERTNQHTNIQYLHARFYLPSLRRFASQDNYDFLNRFMYVNANPIMKNDPSGHWDWKIFGSNIFGMLSTASLIVPGAASGYGAMLLLAGMLTITTAQWSGNQGMRAQSGLQPFDSNSKKDSMIALGIMVAGAIAPEFLGAIGASIKNYNSAKFVEKVREGYKTAQSADPLLTPPSIAGKALKSSWQSPVVFDQELSIVSKSETRSSADRVLQERNEAILIPQSENDTANNAESVDKFFSKTSIAFRISRMTMRSSIAAGIQNAALQGYDIDNSKGNNVFNGGSFASAVLGGAIGGLLGGVTSVHQNMFINRLGRGVLSILPIAIYGAIYCPVAVKNYKDPDNNYPPPPD